MNALDKYNVPDKFKSREDEFRAMTRQWIIKRHERFCAVLPLLKGVEPLRVPKGTKDRYGFTLERMWNDNIWCGDVTLDPLQEFFEIDDGDEILDDMGSDGIADWANHIFDVEFRAVLPAFAHVLDG